MFSLPNKRVLIVDDVLEMAQNIESHLKDMGITRVTIASSVRKAKEYLEESYQNGDPYYLIFCDHHMPEDDGFGLITFIRGNVRFSSIAYISVTSDSEKSTVIQYISKGADSFIVKPADMVNLFERVKAVWEKRGLLKNLKDR